MKSINSVANYSLMLKEWKESKKKIFSLSLGLSLFGVLTVLMMFILPDLITDMPAELFPEINASYLSQTFISNAISIFSIIVVILCADAIAGEREKNTLVLLKTAPIKPHMIILVKTFMRYLLILVATIVSSAVVFLLIAITTEVPDISLYLSALGLFCLTLLFYVTVGILISTLAKTQLNSGAIGVGIIFTISIISSILNQESVKEYNFIQMPVNLFSNDFGTWVMVRAILIIVALSFLFLFVAIVKFSSEKEPTRK
ncbi:MAG: ABC transporter permease [Candidatus Heimdallarchaeaceae archaeon]